LKVSGDASFYGNPVVLEFVAGVLCYYAFQAVPGEAIRAHRVPLIAAGVAAAVAMIVAALATNPPVTAILVGVTSTILVLAAVLAVPHSAGRRQLRHLSRASLFRGGVEPGFRAAFPDSRLGYAWSACPSLLE
jgi:peptidoglycan/LPS O-acetylase OafA/YrhL